MIKEALDSVDSKADQLIRYLGVGTAAAGISLANALDTSNPLAKAALIVGILLAITSIYCALRVRFPSPQAYPIAIGQLFQIRGHYERTDHAQGYASTVVALAIEDRAVISQMKGIWLKRAYRWFNVALVAFAVIVPLCHFWGGNIISWVACLLSRGAAV